MQLEFRNKDRLTGYKHSFSKIVRSDFGMYLRTSYNKTRHPEVVLLDIAGPIVPIFLASSKRL